MPRRESYPEKEPLMDQSKKMSDQSNGQSKDQSQSFAPPKQEADTEDLMAPEPTNHDQIDPVTNQPTRLRGLDLSKYRQPALIDALDRLTSFTYAGSLLLKPALKIGWRSLLYQDAEVRLQDLVSKLQGIDSITQPPTVPNQRGSQQQVHRTLMQRIIHFFLIGLPLSFIVGLAYGVANFITCIWSDIMTVLSLSTNLFESAKSDLNYYYQHPESRPTKDEAVEAWSAQIVGPYTRVLIAKKLGPFGFVSKPIAKVVQKFVHRAASQAAEQAVKYGSSKGFQPFRPAAEVSSH